MKRLPFNKALLHLAVLEGNCCSCCSAIHHQSIHLDFGTITPVRAFRVKYILNHSFSFNRTMWRQPQNQGCTNMPKNSCSQLLLRNSFGVTASAPHFIPNVTQPGSSIKIISHWTFSYMVRQEDAWSGPKSTPPGICHTPGMCHPMESATPLLAVVYGDGWWQRSTLAFGPNL